MRWLSQLVAPLRVRFILVFSAIALAAYLFSGFSLFQSMLETAEASNRQRLITEVSKLRESVETRLSDGQSLPQVWENIDLFNVSGRTIVVYELSSQRLLGSSERADRAAIDKALAAHATPAEVMIQTTEAGVLVATIPLLSGGVVVGVLQMIGDGAGTDVLSANLTSRLSIGLFFILLAVIGAGLFLSANVTRTIHEIEQAADGIARGDFGRQIEVQSHDEIGRLARKINEMAARLQALSNARAVFLSKVSHELLTPLTTMNLACRLLLRSEMDEQQQRYLQMVDQQVAYLQVLVQDLLLLSVSDAGKLRLNPSTIELMALSRQVMETMEPQARQKEIELRFIPAEETLLAGVDGVRLRQAIINLVKNGIKFTGTGGHITLMVRQIDHQVELIVEDSGRGIPPDRLPHVFDGFHQVQLDSDGMGLGLAIVKEVVSAHQGTISVESQPGEGSRFTIRLPLNGVTGKEPGSSTGGDVVTSPN